LKLKLRRKAKRAKLMSGSSSFVGGAAETELEEGIRTGWVCVNIGRVDGGELPEQKARREERAQRTVGFGMADEGGCSLVVQLMTEEKRGEMDLEKLWMGMLRRSEKATLLERESQDDGEVVSSPASDAVVVNDGGSESRAGT
jgi:hypothetical protein